MEQKNSYEVTNPVFITAKMTSFFLAESGNKYAKRLIDRTGFDKDLAYKGNPAFAVTLLPNMVGQDVRYEAVNRLVRKAGNKNIIDFACGFSPRGLEMAGEGYEYHGGDLQMVVPVIGPIVKELAGSDADKINYYVVDVTDLKSCLDAAETMEGPVTIITEGLMPYLNEVEKKTVFENVAAILKKKGGCYICPDFNNNTFALKICQVLLGADGLAAVMKTQEQFSKNGDSDTNAQMIEPRDVVERILCKVPLKFEMVELYPASEDVRSYSLVKDSATLTQLKKYIAEGIILYAEYDAKKDSLSGNAENTGNEFAVSCEKQGSDIYFTVTGKMDSITSPEVVELFRKNDSKDTVNVDFDLAGLNYISSAGLRVLLSIKKNIKGSLTVRNILPNVKEVILMTGFDKVLDIKD